MLNERELGERWERAGRKQGESWEKGGQVLRVTCHEFLVTS
jgi:hypothetical protein